jgi:hypothetical protein
MNVPGVTQFRSDGKRIPNCLSRPATGSGAIYTSTCTWKPSTSGAVTLSVIATPSDLLIAPTTYRTQITVARRLGNR